MPKSRRSHIPSLPPDRLEKAALVLQTLRISPAGKKQLESMLRAAANPNAERIDVVIATLDPARRQNIEQTTRDVTKQTRSRLRRGRDRLLALDNFDELVEEANRD